MVQKCKNCGEPIIRFPLKDSEGKFIIKNFFKMSWDSIILLVIVIALVVSYTNDTKVCMSAIEDPMWYCNSTNTCRVLINQEVNTQFVDPSGINVFDLNITT